MKINNNDINKIVFIDKDSIIKPNTLEFYFGVPGAIKKLNKNNIKVVMISNEHHIEDDESLDDKYNEEINKIKTMLRVFGARLHSVYYSCFDGSLDSIPNPGMVNMEMNNYKNYSYIKYMISNNLPGIEVGRNSNSYSILLHYGNKKVLNEINTISRTPTINLDNIYSAVNYIIHNPEINSNILHHYITK